MAVEASDLRYTEGQRFGRTSLDGDESMKMPWFILFALLLVGCASTPPKTSLTVEQATAIAQRMANEKAFELYQCRPFLGNQPAQFVAGEWIWTKHQGFGLGDIYATVELAADGSSRKVDVQLLDSRLLDNRNRMF